MQFLSQFRSKRVWSLVPKIRTITLLMNQTKRRQSQISNFCQRIALKLRNIAWIRRSMPIPIWTPKFTKITKLPKSKLKMFRKKNLKNLICKLSSIASGISMILMDLGLLTSLRLRDSSSISSTIWPKLLNSTTLLSRQCSNTSTRIIPVQLTKTRWPLSFKNFFIFSLKVFLSMKSSNRLLKWSNPSKLKKRLSHKQLKLKRLAVARLLRKPRKRKLRSLLLKRLKKVESLPQKNLRQWRLFLKMTRLKKKKSKILQRSCKLKSMKSKNLRLLRSHLNLKRLPRMWMSYLNSLSKRL